jgi:hypothetical protein
MQNNFHVNAYEVIKRKKLCDKKMCKVYFEIRRCK